MNFLPPQPVSEARLPRNQVADAAGLPPLNPAGVADGI
jgi:hypothetical protein